MLVLLQSTIEVLVNSVALALMRSHHDLHSELESKQKEVRVALIATSESFPRVDLIFLLKAGDSHEKASTKSARIADLAMHEKSNLELHNKQKPKSNLKFTTAQLSGIVLCSVLIPLVFP